MNDGKISVRYARALYNLACENKCEQIVYESLRRFSNAVSKAIGSFDSVLKNPVIGNEKKIELIVTAIGEPIPDCLKSFVKFIVEQGRESKIYLIALKYQEQYRADKNILLTHITTASELSPETLEKIKASIANLFKANVEAVVSIDPKLIGGYTLDIENNLLDASIAGQLNKVKEELRQQNI